MFKIRNFNQGEGHQLWLLVCRRVKSTKIGKYKTADLWSVNKETHSINTIYKIFCFYNLHALIVTLKHSKRMITRL
jgi:hypothetical protein